MWVSPEGEGRASGSTPPLSLSRAGVSSGRGARGPQPPLAGGEPRSPPLPGDGDIHAQTCHGASVGTKGVRPRLCGRAGEGGQSVATPRSKLVSQAGGGRSGLSGCECVSRAVSVRPPLAIPKVPRRFLRNARGQDVNNDAGGGEGERPGGAAPSSTTSLETLPLGLAILGRAHPVTAHVGCGSSPLFLLPSADFSSPSRVETHPQPCAQCLEHAGTCWNVPEHAGTPSQVSCLVSVDSVS